MRFETSTKIRSNMQADELARSLASAFAKVANKVTALPGGGFEVRGVETTFGSINRADTTLIRVQRATDGYLVTGEVNYRPSFMFWVFLLLGLFTWVLWILPIVFYLTQKSSVRTAIEKVFDRVKNEHGETGAAVSVSSASELETLHRLKEQGIISEDEFAASKTKFLARG
jgi:ribosomal protein S20